MSAIEATDGSGRSVPEGRRARVRRETLAELKRATLEEIRATGAVGLSLRSVARRMGMSPAGLYRYVDSREALLTLLIADGYHDLGHHLEVALGAPAGRGGVDDRPLPAPPMVAGEDADVADRLRAVARTYRSWSVTHPGEFGLLFGDPIPGYAAPEGGPTVEGMTRMGSALGRPLLEAYRQGRLRLHPAHATPELVARLGPMEHLVGDLPLELSALLLLAWGRLHGQVSLEVFGHHHWLFPEGCEQLFDADLEAMLLDLGIAPAPGAGA